VDVSLDKHHVILSVTDNGPGIPAADRERIFERFYRVGNDRHSSGQSGCGLGLAIVKNIALLHDAHIEVTDAPFESGTSFTVYFRRLEMS
jgi:Signal transduction histidine kinase